MYRSVCQEWPQVAFTIRNIAEELLGRATFEIIAINNFAHVLKKAGAGPDRGNTNIKRMAKELDWLTVIDYQDKLSHWNAKRVGIEHSKADILWFCDAHCILARNSLYNMLRYYQSNYEWLDGSIHLPLTYHILESKRLMYRLKCDLSKGLIEYTFRELIPDDNVYEVPCMSTCGMMITRELYDYTGGWPTELGNYGGGENFINYVLAILGKKKYLFPSGLLCHHGDKRGYDSNFYDQVKNKAIAMFLVGGEEYTKKYTDYAETTYVCNKPEVRSIYFQAVQNCREQRKYIWDKQVTDIASWIASWKGVFKKSLEYPDSAITNCTQVQREGR